MGRLRSGGGGGEEGTAHRTGPLKQTNKRHKTGKHRSKGTIDVQTRGRVNSTSGSISKRKGQGGKKKSERKKQAAAERMRRMAETIGKKKALGGGRGAPIAIAMIPLSSTTNLDFMLKYILAEMEKSSSGTVLNVSPSGALIRLGNGKTVQFLLPPPQGDLWGLLDTLKVADVALFLAPTLEELVPEAWTLLKTAKEQGLPTPFVAVSSAVSKSEEKAWLKGVARVLPADRVFPLTNPAQVSTFLRIVTSTKIVIPKQWSLRSSIFLESFISHHSVKPSLLHPNYLSSLPEGEAELGLLEISGVVRRKNLNPFKPIYLPGLGPFRILTARVTPIRVPESILIPEQVELQRGLDDVSALLPPRFVFDPLAIPQQEVDEEDNADEEMDEAGSDVDALSEADFETGSQMSLDLNAKGKKKSFLPKGTSDYQADWLDENIINSDDELEGNDGDSEKTDDEDEEEMDVDWEEEKRELEKRKEARTEAEFPDWIDTPMEVGARERFQKYRGLESFKSSAWDVNENLPKEYSKIIQFQNFRHVWKSIAGEKAEDDGSSWIPLGQRVTLLLKPLDEETAQRLMSPLFLLKPTLAVSLLKHETRFSVLNLQINLTDVVKNKEELIIQLGYSRFKASPVLSEVSPGNKHKMLRYGQPGSTVMASIFAPVTFQPASVLAFRGSGTGAELTSVGAGSLFSVDPQRLIIKRVLLSGHPFKVTNKKAVVRFMFFNRDDVNWFKPVELKTRYGRRGHIKEPLGTHGHMKCTFDGTMKSQDTVLMALYKRVFPKWTYDPVQTTFIVFP